MDSSEIVASRQLELVRNNGARERVHVTIGLPRPRPEGGVSCAYEISGAGLETTFYAVGFDSIHAIQGAMYLIGMHLEGKIDPSEGKLRWAGGEGDDLGFPDRPD